MQLKPKSIETSLMFVIVKEVAFDQWEVVDKRLTILHDVFLSFKMKQFENGH